MLFLLNLVIVAFPEKTDLPKDLTALRKLSPEGVLQAGATLYEKHPSLEVERPDMARWFCALLAHKYPSASAAIFRPQLEGRGLEVCVADIPFPSLARVWRHQRDGDPIHLDVFQNLWSKARLLA